MREWLLRLLIFALIQLAIAIVVIPAAFSRHRPGYLAALEDKIDLLESDGPPRVLFVGDSSVAFGISSEVFQKELEQPAVNLGLHASLGLDFYLRLVEAHGRQGDTVVLLPSYPLLLSTGEIPPEEIRRVLRNCPSAAPYLQGNVASGKKFVDTMALSEVAYWTQKAYTVHQANFRQWKKNRKRGKRNASQKNQRRASKSQSIYRRSSFNEFGDMVAHHGRTRPEKLKGHAKLCFDEAEFEKTTERLNQFAEVCREKGIRVYLSYTPVTSSMFEESKAEIERLDSDLRDQLSHEITILGSPDQLAYPESEFFDSVYHLTEAGQQRRSKELAQKLTPLILANRAKQPELR